MRWKRAFIVMAWLLGIGLMVPLATVECVYRTALARVPALPQKVTGPPPPASWNQGAWVHSEHTATLHVKPVWPGTVLFTVAKVLLDGQPSRSPGDDAYPSGFKLAKLVARLWSHQLSNESPRAPSALEQLALAVWLTRTWSAEELLAFKAHHLWFGRSHFGVAAAAPALLNKEVARLDIADVAFLLAISEKAWDVECAPDRLQRRRDALLDGLATVGVATHAEVEAARSAPLPLGAPAEGTACRQY
ncbi:transglycosylase domain-containing protein [Comamonas sp. JC664]|uniref:transglycosylase domain-containing protein n=1 Tax=Comamonas sp. JC664 TaxID=2801917 RepID=UPI00174CEB9B|nr:transglycosylase domain-containing protein [Comamonas sp. JC664]MBL0698511.1 transglycosylase domain-containing protein [Comamonas sp. JC664]GHH00227.1 hypothetical protein GCM10012319_67160 [Comamonas sp. KCTC 72670]